MTQLPFPHPSEMRNDIDPTHAGIVDANYAARSVANKRPPFGYGIIFEVQDGRIVGAQRVENSPVLRPEASFNLHDGRSSRQAMVLVEAYGYGPAPAGNIRWAADLYATDRNTVDFVIRAIEEKLQADQAIAFGSTPKD